VDAISKEGDSYCCTATWGWCSAASLSKLTDKQYKSVRIQANSAFPPSWVGIWGPASAGKAKAGMIHSVSGWTRGVQVKLWDPLRTRAIPERLRGVFTTRRYKNPRLPYVLLCRGVTTPTRSVRGLLATIFIPCAHSVSMGGNGDFENRHQIIYFFTYQPEIWQTPRGRQYTKSHRFWFLNFVP